MRSLPTVLALLSLPAAAIAYVATVRVLEWALPDQTVLTLLVPLFVAGLAMMPFLIPFVDRRARQDLAEHARQQAATSDTPTDAGTPAAQPPDPPSTPG